MSLYVKCDRCGKSKVLLDGYLEKYNAWLCCGSWRPICSDLYESISTYAEAFQL